MQATNAEHLRSVNDMGIVLVALAEGKVQLVHSFYNVSQISYRFIMILLFFFSSRIWFWFGLFVNLDFSLSAVFLKYVKYWIGQITTGRREGSALHAGNGRAVQTTARCSFGYGTAGGLFPETGQHVWNPNGWAEPLQPWAARWRFGATADCLRESVPIVYW